MKYGELGRSGMNVSKICLGTMHFGPKATEEESHAILDKALSMGITFIDTANVYGGETARGRSEEIIGTWFSVRAHGDRRGRALRGLEQFTRAGVSPSGRCRPGSEAS
jgi:aryl-alcohol dehydrogenase-like predicted oxidoreductase